MGKIRGSPEKNLQNSIIEWMAVKYPTIKAWLQPSTGTFSPKKGVFLKRKSKFAITGISDIIGIMPNGIWLAIECKIKPNKPTEEQINFLTMIKDRGGIGLVAYTLEDAERGLKSEILNHPELLKSPHSMNILERRPVPAFPLDQE